MGLKRKKNRINGASERTPSWLRREIVALLLFAAGIFYYLCVLSYSPLDPSFFTSARVDSIGNLGGLIGSYVAGVFFFFFGGASYFIGVYFVFNSILLFANKRQRLRFLDFFVFILCASFFAIFLQLQMVEISYGGFHINAGGTIGKLLGEIGHKYLGSWGVYLIVLVGMILTFILATKLSLVEAINTSTVIIGRGMNSLGGRLLLYFIRLKDYVLVRLSVLKDWNKRRTVKINTNHVQKKTLLNSVLKQPFQNTKSQIEEKKMDDVLDGKDGAEPRIYERKDKKQKNYNQMELQNISADYQLPPLAFLDSKDEEVRVIDPDSLKMSARLLESKLKDFAIEGRVSEIHPGPVVTMYEFQPAPGVKLSRIHNLTDDLSLAMGGRPVRVVAPLPNKAAIGIEIPNHNREMVWLKELLSDERFQKSESRLVFALGKDIEGTPYLADLQKMPHLLVAGSTGSGKSVAINTMICSMLYKARPDEVKMIMIDPKMIELSIYEGIPHLMLPVVTDPRKANLALKWAVREMERRYQLMSDLNVRNLMNYNKKIAAGLFKNKEPDPTSEEAPILHDGELPYIVIVIDEFADLMMACSKDVEESVCRLAQKARASGIHLILATQRPSVDVITGIIKANFPSRVAFRVTSKHDARTILDTNGAENLLGMGDMLFIPPGSSKRLRLHGAFLSEDEIMRIVTFLKKQAKPTYFEEILSQPEGADEYGFSQADFDEYYDQAVRSVCESRKVSISSIQRMYRIGYNRAARIVEQMESQGIVSKPNGQGQREVLVSDI